MTYKPHYKLVTGVPQKGDIVVVNRPRIALANADADADVAKIGMHGVYSFFVEDVSYPHEVWVNCISDNLPLERDEFIALREK